MITGGIDYFNNGESSFFIYCTGLGFYSANCWTFGAYDDVHEILVAFTYILSLNVGNLLFLSCRSNQTILLSCMTLNLNIYYPLSGNCY
jgi:hypothetical protein